MISAGTQPAFETLTARLAARARAIAEARRARIALARRGDPRRWRRAALLWPLFSQG